MAEQAHIVARIAALDQGSFKDGTKQAFQLIASCYERDEFVECIEGAQHILNTYPLNTQMRLKVCIYMAMSTKERGRRGRLRDLAEITYAAIITDSPAGKSPGNNLINARKEIDALTAASVFSCYHLLFLASALAVICSCYRSSLFSSPYYPTT